jgi:hypothetical protein
MAFGGSGWAGGLREVRGLVLAVDMAPLMPVFHLSYRGDGVPRRAIR